MARVGRRNLDDVLLRADDERSREWVREIEDRIGQIERGEVELVSWEEVEARIRRTLAR